VVVADRLSIDRNQRAPLRYRCLQCETLVALVVVVVVLLLLCMDAIPNERFEPCVVNHESMW
jgi:hypothetical protein